MVEDPRNVCWDSKGYLNANVSFFVSKSVTVRNAKKEKVNSVHVSMPA